MPKQSEVLRLGRNSIAYFAMNMGVRGIAFVLIPIYARHLSPEQYGVLALCNVLVTLLGTVMTLAVHGSLSRMHVTYTVERDRRVLVGTILCFFFVFSGGLTVALEILGRLGLFDGLFSSVPFVPCLELALWTAFLGIFMNVPATIYAAEERPWRVLAVTFISSIVQGAFTLYFVVHLRQGAVGGLRGAFISTAIVAALGLALALRRGSRSFDAAKLKMALQFGVPLVPHTVAHWALSVSDRLILQRFVSTGDVGRYSIGYQVGELASLVLSPIEAAIRPMQMRQLAQGDDQAVKQMGTLAVIAVDVAAVGVALFGTEAIRLVLPEKFQGGASIVPWVAAGTALRAHYIVSSTGIWHSMKTRGLPIATIAAGVINVALNFLLIPRFGMAAAGATTAIGYGCLAFFADRIAARAYKIDWEYARWGRAALVCAGCVVAAAVGNGCSFGVRVALKLGLLVVVLPTGLLLARVVSRYEMLRAIDLVRHLLLRRREVSH